MRFALIAVALLCAPLEAQAQALRPAAFSRPNVETSWRLDTVRTQASLFAPPRRAVDSVSATATSGIRARPIVIGVAIGALLGTGVGAFFGAAYCEGPCSNRQEMAAGALIGAGVGGLFGLILGLPPRGNHD